MTAKIRVLNEDTINKIAAGEVIENPASVVKELVENAIDAGATEIVIEIKGGGRQLIRVTDNGSGMNRDDALLCLERHATSKIRSVDDLEGVMTMGFRGEALPSIASISQFTLLTRLPQADQGTLVAVDGGKITRVADVACSTGTSIEVKNLFFNVPVRRKFLKSPAVDSHETVKMVTKIALGHPALKFQLIVEGKEELHTQLPKSGAFEPQLKQRVAEVLGREIAEQCRYVEQTSELFTLKGLIGLPSETRHNRTGQWLFINGRAVVSPLVSMAIKDGYGPVLPVARYPVFVLHMDVPGTLIDVNVHPQKKEVRLRQEPLFREQIAKAVQASLQKTGLPARSPISPVFAEAVRLPLPFDEKPAYCFSERSFPTRCVAEKPSAQLLLEEVVAAVKPTSMRVVMTLAGYLVAESDSKICIIDQKAAHARILYETGLKAMQGKKTALQPLLVPYSIELLAAEAAQLRTLLPELLQFGFQIREFGPRTFLIDAIPDLLQNEDVRILILEILNSEMGTGNEIGMNERARKMAIAINRRSLSAKKKLSLFEGQALLDQLGKCENATTCPQGKPIAVFLSIEEIAKRFYEE